MIAVITGDIVNSKKDDSQNWLNLLKNTLNQYGSEPQTWEIYRGDSFQLSINPEKALIAALHIKSMIKQTKIQDVRLAIGVGSEKHKSQKITESNGSAYVNSGECFESLKKQTLAIKTDDKDLNEALNIMLDLSLLTADHWSVVVSEVIKTAIENPDKNQRELAELLAKSQSNISEALKRGGFDEIMAMNQFYMKNILK
ncbi:SatD family protein [Psychroflexus halocasei]|uniref:SatD family (SatD) n=1 Tax=Psychroflexus halocasei TaxID=908615 RepID=A0A1H3ZWJ6_9FLAO|nr:SatD family protein [Psychroflexus halocasei]SEA27791.1 SatD family (SatD) [Psychroflexus halocasei]